MKKSEIIGLLKFEMIQYNSTRKEYKTINTLIKLAKKLPYKDMNIRLTQNSFINKGDLMEYIAAYSYFGLSSYELDNKPYDVYLNGKMYEIKGVALNPSTELKNDIDILIVLEIKKDKVYWYEIPFSTNKSLKGQKISNKLLENLIQYRKTV